MALTSLRVDRGTDRELLILTSLDCHFCRVLNESDDMEEMPITTVKVLSDWGPKDQIANMVIFKSLDPKAQFKHLLTGGTLDPATVDWTRDVTAEYNENRTLFNTLQQQFQIDGNPNFIVKEPDGTYTLIEPKYADPVEVFVNTVRPYLT